MSTPIRVLLVDDHQMLREGLRSLLAQQPGIEVVGEATDGREAVRLAEDLSPSVIVMDVSMPGLNGVEATRQVVANVPGAKVLALSVHADKRFVDRMLEAGAAGYLLKTAAFRELVTAISEVAAGQVYLGPRVAGPLVKDYLGFAADREPSPLSLLTPREREVLQLLAEGKPTREIAALLFLSQKTVDVHRQNLMRKLQVRNLAELVKYAIREGLTSLDA